MVRSHRRDIDALRGAEAVLLSEHSQRWYEIQRQRTPRNICEVEAEGVAFILCPLLRLPGLDELLDSSRAQQLLYLLAKKGV